MLRNGEHYCFCIYLRNDTGLTGYLYSRDIKGNKQIAGFLELSVMEAIFFLFSVGLPKQLVDNFED